MENIKFKKWIQTHVKKNIAPTLADKGFKKGRTNCFVREREGTVQFLQFEEIPNLNKLMEAASYDVPDNDNWNGVKWYALGVYECLMEIC